jgi:hypothetical protein
LDNQRLVERISYGKYQLKSRPDYDQKGLSCRSALSKAQEVTPCEGQPAPPRTSGEVAEEDTAPTGLAKGQDREKFRQAPSRRSQVPGLAQENMVSPKEMMDSTHKPELEEEPRSPEIPDIDDPEEIVAAINLAIEQRFAELDGDNEETSLTEKRKKTAELYQFTLRLFQRLREKAR